MTSYYNNGKQIQIDLLRSSELSKEKESQINTYRKPNHFKDEAESLIKCQNMQINQNISPKKQELQYFNENKFVSAQYMNKSQDINEQITLSDEQKQQILNQITKNKTILEELKEKNKQRTSSYQELDNSYSIITDLRQNSHKLVYSQNTDVSNSSMLLCKSHYSKLCNVNTQIKEMIDRIIFNEETKQVNVQFKQQYNIKDYFNVINYMDCDQFNNQSNQSYIQNQIKTLKQFSQQLHQKSVVYNKEYDVENKFHKQLLQTYYQFLQLTINNQLYFNILQQYIQIQGDIQSDSINVNQSDEDSNASDQNIPKQIQFFNQYNFCPLFHDFSNAIELNVSNLNVNANTFKKSFHNYKIKDHSFLSVDFTVKMFDVKNLFNQLIKQKISDSQMTQQLVSNVIKLQKFVVSKYVTQVLIKSYLNNYNYKTTMLNQFEFLHFMQVFMKQYFEFYNTFNINDLSIDTEQLHDSDYINQYISDNVNYELIENQLIIIDDDFSVQLDNGEILMRNNQIIDEQIQYDEEQQQLNDTTDSLMQKQQQQNKIQRVE